MAWQDVCGAELGDVNTEPAAVTGTVVVDGNTKNNGGSTASYRMNCAGTAAAVALGAYSTAGSWNAGNPVLGAGIGYFYFAAAPVANATILQVEANANATPNGTAMQFTAVLTTARKLQLKNAAGTQVGSDSAVLATNTWHKLEWKCSGLNVSGSVNLELKVNGNVVGTTATATNNAIVSGIGSVWYGCLTNTTLDIRWDDLAWQDAASYISGAFAVTGMYPNVSGTYSGWTTGTGSTYTEADDWVANGAADDDTTYLRNNGSSDKITLNMTSPGAGTTVYMLKNVVRARMESASVFYQMERSGSTDVDGSGSSYLLNLNSIGATYTTRKRLQEVDPNGGGALSASALNAIEIGFISSNTATSVNRVTAFGAVVGSSGVTTGSSPVAQKSMRNQRQLSGKFTR